MISALKMTADRIAEDGLASPMTFNALSCGYVVANAAGMIAKYFCYIVRDTECRERSAGHQHLFARLNHRPLERINSGCLTGVAIVRSGEFHETTGLAVSPPSTR
jgi:hypothetical protein